MAAAFLVSRVVIFVVAEAAIAILGQRAGDYLHEAPAMAALGRWDAVHYIEIASTGYRGTNVAFFPLYPLLLAVLGRVLGSYLIAGLIISNAAFFLALLFLYKLVILEFDRRCAQRALWYISIFPTAFFFSIPYSESLFLLLIVGTFYFLRTRRWWTAGVFGLLASATRAPGILLVVPFAIEWLDAYRTSERRPVPGVAAVSFVPLGIVGYMAYLGNLFHDPLAFMRVQSHWGRNAAPPWMAFVLGVRAIVYSASRAGRVAHVFELAFSTLVVVGWIAALRRLRPSYLAYTALAFLVPLCTASLEAMPRYAIVLFPLFMILALWGEKRAANWAIVAVSLPLLVFFTALFAIGYWVA